MRKETKTQVCLPPLKSWKNCVSQKSTICASQSTNNTPFLCHATVLSFGGLAPALSANLDHDAAGSWERWHPRQSCRKQNSEWLKTNKQESGPVGQVGQRSYEHVFEFNICGSCETRLAMKFLQQKPTLTGCDYFAISSHGHDLESPFCHCFVQFGINLTVNSRGKGTRIYIYADSSSRKVLVSEMIMPVNILAAALVQDTLHNQLH